MSAMKSPEVPRENVRERAPDVVNEWANVVDNTRNAFRELSQRVSLPEGFTHEQFAV